MGTPIQIGLGLTLVPLIGFPVTNPARSTGPALFVGAWTRARFCPFGIAPIAGAAPAGLAHPTVAGKSEGD